MPENLEDKLKSSVDAAVEGAAEGASNVINDRVAGGPMPITSRNIGIAVGISALISFLRRFLKKR